MSGLINGSRASYLTHPPTRFSPLRMFRSRSYTKAREYKDPTLVRRPSENNELSSSRSWITYAIPPAILLIFGAGMYVRRNEKKQEILQGLSQTSSTGRSNTNRPAFGGPFKLFNTENQLITECDLQGNWVLMCFGYTSSPDVGPTEVQKMAKVTDILESAHKFMIKPVFITIDPQRDSPAQLRAYLKEFDPRIVGLTGSSAAVRQIAQEYRVYFRKVEEDGQDYLVECSNKMYLLDPNMEIVKCFGAEYDASQLSDAIMKEVSIEKS